MRPRGRPARQLNIDGCPDEDPLQPNDWQGLPRPKQPILGLDLTKGGPWLDEAEILQLADRLAAEEPEFVVQNQIGDAEIAFRLAIDPSEAPVHAVSFVLAATSGVYDGTTWHRVVPSFVIQGGDPHGDGSGDAGWSVPDEITRARFVRGALGMPKGEVRDTGGCQLFVMHSDYRPLDGRYTCYGRVTAGMDTVDKIRVGDRITGVRMVVVSRGGRRAPLTPAFTSRPLPAPRGGVRSESQGRVATRIRVNPACLTFSIQGRHSGETATPGASQDRGVRGPSRSDFDTTRRRGCGARRRPPHERRRHQEPPVALARVLLGAQHRDALDPSRVPATARSPRRTAPWRRSGRTHAALRVVELLALGPSPEPLAQPLVAGPRRA